MWYQRKFPNLSKVLHFIQFLLQFSQETHSILSKIFFFLSTMASAATTTTTTSSANGSALENPLSSLQDSPMDDPLFLHHAKSPSLVLVTWPLIGGENYSA